MLLGNIYMVIWISMSVQMYRASSIKGVHQQDDVLPCCKYDVYYVGVVVLV